MKRIGILMVLLMMLGCARSPGEVEATNPPTPTAPGQKKLVAVGDSLTEGMGVDPEEAYPAQLEGRLKEMGLDWQVINAGLSGETSSGALARLEWVLKTEPDAVILVTGANDGLRGVDPAVTKENLQALVAGFKAQGVPVLIGGMKAPPNLGDDYTEAFEGLYEVVAEEEQVELIPFFLEGVARNPELNQEDGKHPNAEGYTEIVERILPVVVDWLP